MSTTSSDPALLEDVTRVAVDRPPSAESNHGVSRSGRSPALDRGDALGRYVILETLGAGGMGVVYAAYDHDLDRKVAIKLLRPELGRADETSTGVTRLMREAQAMAKLNHRNVVAVHDVGTHEGAVFVAMEFVEGETLGDWMDRGAQPFDEVLPLLSAAGHGLAAAHRAGLVHRDFKPDNVLLGADGAVRVADFGLARAGEGEATGDDATLMATAIAPPDDAAEDLSDAESGSVARVVGRGSESGTRSVWTSGSALSTKLTRTGAIMGTPAYMAPEQHQGLPSDHRADQFAFCVVLFEALAGVRPFEGGTIHELALNVCKGKMRELPRAAGIPGRVRTIIERGLAVSPADRFPSMEALLETLDDDPRGRRRRWLAGSVGVVLCAAALAWGIYAEHRDSRCTGFDTQVAATWGDGQRDALQRALRETGVPYAADTASRVSGLLDTWSTEWTAQAHQSCVATHLEGSQSAHLLDLRTACLDRARTDVAVTLEVLATPGEDTVDRAVEAIRATTDLSACADLDRLLARVAPPDDPAVAARVEAVRDELGRGRAQLRGGRYPEALATTRAAHATAMTLDYPPIQAEASARLAASGTRNEDAELVRRAVTQAVSLGLASGDDAAAASASYHMFWTLANARDEAGLQFWRDLSESLAERVGDDDLRINLRTSEASALRKLGQLDVAERRLVEALKLSRSRYGQGHLTQAAPLLNLSGVRWEKGEFAAAGEASEQARVIWTRELGPDHPRTMKALSTSGVLRLRVGEAAKAEEMFQAVADSRARVMGKTSRTYADALSNVCAARETLPDMAGTLKICREVVDLYVALDGEDSLEVAQSRCNLANILRSAGQLDAAGETVDACITTLAAILGPDDGHVLPVALTIRGEIARARGDTDAALADIRQAQAMADAALGRDNAAHAERLRKIAELLIDRGDPAAALSAGRRALQLSEGETWPAEHWGSLYFCLARSLLSTGGDAETAREYGRTAAEHLRDDLPAAADDLREVEEWLATTASP